MIRNPFTQGADNSSQPSEVEGDGVVGWLADTPLGRGVSRAATIVENGIMWSDDRVVRPLVAALVSGDKAFADVLHERRSVTSVQVVFGLLASLVALIVLSIVGFAAFDTIVVAELARIIGSYSVAGAAGVLSAVYGCYYVLSHYREFAPTTAGFWPQVFVLATPFLTALLAVHRIGILSLRGDTVGFIGLLILVGGFSVQRVTMAATTKVLRQYVLSFDRVSGDEELTTSPARGTHTHPMLWSTVTSSVSVFGAWWGVFMLGGAPLTTIPFLACGVAVTLYLGVVGVSYRVAASYRQAVQQA